LVAASNGGRFLPLGCRNVPLPQLPTSNGNSSQELNCSSLINSLTDRLTHWLTPLQLTSQLLTFITSRHGPRRKRRFPLLLYPIVIETCFFAKPLLSNCYFIFAYFAVVD
jgi:hypothetical protein